MVHARFHCEARWHVDHHAAPKSKVKYKSARQRKLQMRPRSSIAFGTHAFMDYTHTSRPRGDVRAVGRAIPRGWPFTSNEGWPCTRQHEPAEIRPSRRQHPPSEARRHVEANGSTSCRANAATSQKYWHTFTDYTYTSRLRGDVRAVGRAIPRVWPFTSSEGWPCTR